MANKEEIKKNWNLEGEIIKKIKKFEKSRDNIIGIIYDLRDSDDYETALIKYGIYLDDPNTKKDRDALITYSMKLSGRYTEYLKKEEEERKNN